ncbi:hypothetical protein RE6C_06005 [Rhodopirellula europaea 6C]|uniref:Uncharacterized protein n=1 Tax=Rhodopirellula europaea 6C TaxID=1263867 RepID=M2AA41_9BACT|nr:hypothetical protein RE6C_06005 [Rhodopirellula europaea 6C]
MRASVEVSGWSNLVPASVYVAETEGGGNRSARECSGLLNRHELK